MRNSEFGSDLQQLCSHQGSTRLPEWRHLAEWVLQAEDCDWLGVSPSQRVRVNQETEP